MIFQGDSLERMRLLPDNSVDAIVTDPPYFLEFMGKEWDKYNGIDPDFGYWLSGFTDGEGCFRIHKAHGKTTTTYTCAFQIKVRKDDELIIRQIQKQLGFGKICYEKGNENQKDSIKYIVQNKKDCIKLRDVFNKFPLKAKKIKDFIQWSKHLDLWIAHKYGEDKTLMKDSYNDMKDIRSYENTDSPLNKIAFFHYLWSREAIRVLKPGAFLLSFSSTRTYHRMVQGIEDAGFEIRDMISWIYGSGFPKSHNIGKAVDKVLGNEREILGEKVRGDVQKAKDNGSGYLSDPANKNNTKQFGYGTEILTEGNSEWEGWGTALKPACEPIVIARKPLSEKTVALNVLKHGTGGINIDACRVETNEIITNHSRGSESAISKGKYSDSKEQETHQTKGQVLGRFPANVILDEEAGKILDEHTGELKSGSGAIKKATAKGYQGNDYGKESRPVGTKMISHNDKGGASRFFYCAKASKSERNLGMGELWFNSLEIVLNIKDCSDILWKGKITIQEENKAKLLEDMELSLKKAIEESGIKMKNDSDLNIISFGKIILEKYLKDTKCITKMGINLITSQQILSWLRHYTIKEYTLDAFSKMMDGGNLVVDVESLNILKITIKEALELAHGVNPVALEVRLKISESESKNFHSTVKPIKLMEYLVKLVSKEGATVLDPFLGSGTTAIACVNLNRKWIGIEREEDYIKIAEARIKAFMELQ